MSYPTPVDGLVIRFCFQWPREHAQKLTEGKERACVILRVMKSGEGPTRILVCPITHSPPSEDDPSIELSASIKQRLGLDAEPQWVMVTHINRSDWPGFDVRKRTDGTYSYGLVPLDLFAEIMVLVEKSIARVKVVPREDPV